MKSEATERFSSRNQFPDERLLVRLHVLSELDGLVLEQEAD